MTTLSQVAAPDKGADREPFDAGDTAARFFHQFRYQAKAGPSERLRGCEGHYWRVSKSNPLGFERISFEEWRRLDDRQRYQGNITPCLKPLDLCRYLARLMLPPPHADGSPRRLLIPFSGTGSEAIGALLAGWDECVLIEAEPVYCDLAAARIAAWSPYHAARANRIEAVGGIKNESENVDQMGLFD